MMTKVVSDMMMVASRDWRCDGNDGLYILQRHVVGNRSYTAIPCGAACHMGAVRLESPKSIRANGWSLICKLVEGSVHLARTMYESSDMENRGTGCEVKAFSQPYSIVRCRFSGFRCRHVFLPELFQGPDLACGAVSWFHEPR